MGIIGQDPSASNSNQLHVAIFPFYRYEIGVYSIDSSKMIGKFSEVFDWLFLNSTSSYVITLCSPISAGGILESELVSVGHTSFLVKVEWMWV